jgi:hypothetical protein
MLVNLNWEQYLYAPYCGCVTLEHVGALGFRNVPYSDGAIGRRRDQSIAMVFKCPYATFVAFQYCSKRSSLGVIHVDVGIVATGYNFVGVEL